MGLRFLRQHGEDIHRAEKVGPHEEQDRQDRHPQVACCGFEGLQANQGLDRSSTESTQGAWVQWFRGSAEGHSVVQGGQGHLQRLKLEFCRATTRLGIVQSSYYHRLRGVLQSSPCCGRSRKGKSCLSSSCSALLLSTAPVASTASTSTS